MIEPVYAFRLLTEIRVHPMRLSAIILKESVAMNMALRWHCVFFFES